MQEPDPWTAYWHNREVFAFIEHSHPTAGAAHEVTQAAETGRLVDVTFDLVPVDSVLSLLSQFDEHEAADQLLAIPSAQLVSTVSQDLAPQGEWTEGEWHNLAIGQGPHTAMLYRDLDAEQLVTTTFQVGSPLSSDIAQRLSALTSLDRLADATPVSPLATIDSIDIYDVGQGNWTAVASSHLPLLYFDVGGGCLANAKTYPAVKWLRPCTTRSPGILLSHWDFDHWFSAWKGRGAILQESDWYVPQQAVGPTTHKFVNLVKSKGTIHLVRSSIRVGPLEVLKCTGKSKNDSGLALAVQTSKGVALLPGDADFNKIPVSISTIVSGPLTGLVATHHGSGHVSAIPKPAGSGSRICYSYGKPNTFGHPTASVPRYQAEGWTHGLETPIGAVSLCGNHGDPPCGRKICDLGTTQS